MALASLLVRRVPGVSAVVTWTALVLSPMSGAFAQDAPRVPPSPGVPVSQPAPPPPAAAPAKPVAAPPPPAAEPAAHGVAPVSAPVPAEAVALDDDSTESTSEWSLPAPRPAASTGSRAELQRQLQELEQRRAHTTNLLPWLVVGTGAAAVVLGTSLGVASAFDCEQGGTCSAPPWATLAVVVGAAIGTLGAIWLVRANVGINELELKKHQVQTDLDRLDHARLSVRGLAGRATPALSLHASF